MTIINSAKSVIDKKQKRVNLLRALVYANLCGTVLSAKNINLHFEDQQQLEHEHRILAELEELLNGTY